MKKKLPKGAKKLKAHKWKLEKHGHYVEPFWVAHRLFEVEQFTGPILDPCCGFGRIPMAAAMYGHETIATDIVNRGYALQTDISDFLQASGRWSNIVCNPPYHVLQEFTLKALQVARHKVAMIWLSRRLPAASWLSDTPLASVYHLSPRPSMPPGYVVRRYERKGEEPSGGTQDFCWLVWDHAYRGYPKVRWLKRTPDND